MTEDLKPYNYIEDEKLQGISVEIVQSILKELHYNEKIRLYPWARAVNILNTKPNAILFSMSHTPQRANKYKFACPLVEVKTVFFIKEGLDLKTLKDIQNLRVGVVKDFAAHKTLAAKGFENFDFSSSTTVMVQKLQEDKIDTFVASPPTVYGLGLDLTKIKQSDLELYSTNLCIAFNKKISDKEVQAWQEKLLEFKKSQKYKTLYKKYINKGE